VKQQPEKVAVQSRLGWVDGMASDPELSVSAFRVACAIGMRIDHKTGECYPSLKTIAKDASRGLRTVQLAILELEAAGYLIIHRRDLGVRATDGRKVCGGRGKANTYSIGRIRPWNKAGARSQSAASFADNKGGNSRQERWQFSTGKVAASCHPTLSTTLVEPSSASSPSSAYGAPVRQPARQTHMPLPCDRRGPTQKERRPNRRAQGTHELQIGQRLGLGDDYVNDLGRLSEEVLT
jgi:Helix-turn-helix domain